MSNLTARARFHRMNGLAVSRFWKERLVSMALLPLQAVFEGDLAIILVPVDDQDTMEVVAQKVAHHVIHRRLPAKNAPMSIRYNGAVLPQGQTVAEAQMTPMAFVEAFYNE